MLLSAVPERKGGPGPKEHTQLCLDRCLLCDVVGCVYRPFSEEGCRGFAKFQMASVTLKNQWQLSETHSNPVSGHTVSSVVQSGKPAWGGKALSTPGEVQTEPRHLTGCTRRDWWACQAARPGPLGALLSLSQAPSRVPMRQPTQAPQLLSHCVPFPEPPSPFAALPSSEPAPQTALPLLQDGVTVAPHLPGISAPVS